MATDPKQIQSVLGLIDREVWVITAEHEESRGGLTASWVLPPSIDSERPQLLIGLAPEHATAKLVEASGAFVAHLLTSQQSDIAFHFGSSSSRDRDKLAGVPTIETDDGRQMLRDCLAWCDCRVFARYSTGDRLLFWADVVAAEHVNRLEKPLREQALMSALSPEQRQLLGRLRQADAAAQRAPHERWRKSQRGTAGPSNSGDNRDA